jgi:hypothetical protein
MIIAVALADLVELVWVALVVTIVLSASASLCVLGVTRAQELRRSGNGAATSAYAALGIACAAVVVTGIAAGLAVIISG